MHFFKSYLTEYDPGLANLSEETQQKIKEDMLVEVNRLAYFLLLAAKEIFLNLRISLTDITLHIWLQTPSQEWI